MSEGRGVVDVVRDGHARQCSAHTRSGAQCRAFAVEGMTVCRMHGGSSPQARRAAERRKAEQQATALLETVWREDAPPVENVIDALHELAGQLKHAIGVLGSRLESQQLDSPDGIAWRAVIRDQRRLLADIARLGIDEKRVQLEQERAHMVTSAFRAALAVVELLPADRDLVIRTFLEQLGASVAAAPGPVVRGEVG